MRLIMLTRSGFTISSLALLVVGASAGIADGQTQKPDILVIFGDDIGR